MSINNRSFQIGSVFYQNGYGVPIHIATIGCVYIDTQTGKMYINKDGIAHWEEFIDASATSGFTSNLQQVYENSTPPKITINSSLNSISIENGTGNPDDETILLQGINSSGDTISVITASGLITGNSLSVSNNLVVGSTTGDTSAILDVTSTTKGFLPPRMTNAERLAITSPAIGLVVYCTDTTEGLYTYTNLGWKFILNDVTGYVPENVANKAIDFSTINDTLYPSIKAVDDAKSELVIFKHFTTPFGFNTTDQWYTLTTTTNFFIAPFNTATFFGSGTTEPVVTTQLRTIHGLISQSKPLKKVIFYVDYGDWYEIDIAIVKADNFSNSSINPRTIANTHIRCLTTTPALNTAGVAPYSKYKVEIPCTDSLDTPITALCSSYHIFVKGQANAGSNRPYFSFHF